MVAIIHRLILILGYRIKSYAGILIVLVLADTVGDSFSTKEPQKHTYGQKQTLIFGPSSYTGLRVSLTRRSCITESISPASRLP